MPDSFRMARGAESAMHEEMRGSWERGVIVLDVLGDVEADDGFEAMARKLEWDPRFAEGPVVRLRLARYTAPDSGSRVTSAWLAATRRVLCGRRESSSEESGLPLQSVVDPSIMKTLESEISDLFRRPDAGRAVVSKRAPSQGDCPSASPVSLSVLVLAYNEAGNISSVLQGIRSALEPTELSFEIIVVDGGSADGTVEISESKGARVVTQSEKGYANALREGFALCTGDHITTLDADQSHDPKLLLDLLAQRQRADLVIASRYVPNGHAKMPYFRRILSEILNRTYSIALGLPIRDMSSGFRLYSRRMLGEIQLEGRYFDVLPEIAVKAYLLGYRVREIPFHYQPRKAGRSHARILRFGAAYAGTLWRCRKHRDSIRRNPESVSGTTKTKPQRHEESKQHKDA